MLRYRRSLKIFKSHNQSHETLMKSIALTFYRLSELLFSCQKPFVVSTTQGWDNKSEINWFFLLTLASILNYAMLALRRGGCITGKTWSKAQSSFIDSLSVFRLNRLCEVDWAWSQDGEFLYSCSVFCMFTCGLRFSFKEHFILMSTLLFFSFNHFYGREQDTFKSLCRFCNCAIWGLSN